MLDKILGKSEPEKTLVKHTDDLLDVWKEIYKRYSEIIDVDNEFWYYSYLSLLFHDLGKITENFQEVITKKKKYNAETYIRHEFLSSVFLLSLNPKYFANNPLPVFAVMSHHKPLNDELFSSDSTKKMNFDVEILKEFIEYVEDRITKKFNKKLNYDNRLLKFYQNTNTEILYNNLKESFYKNSSTNLTIKSRKEYIYYKAILQISDWFASGGEKLYKPLSYDIKILESKIIKLLKEDGKLKDNEQFNFRNFQNESNISKNVIAIAPTGSGKTEASLIWASNKDKYSRILYLLPTRVTSNAIFKRLCKYFNENEVAIIHSSAYFFKKEIDEDFSKLDYLYDKSFFKNINICTIDQVLTQGFNLGFWEFKTFNSLNAKIIIDEIHLYQPYTLGLIISTIKYLKNEFGATFYIMSATMPKKLKNLLADTLSENKGQLKIIEDKELLNKKRNLFEVKDKLVDEINDEIIQEIENSKKILIVVNTVNEAIRLYDKYKVYTNNIICYHSRFTQNDRIKKEKEILQKEKSNKSLLLIATQVVEISLDIDFDILFTENAPIDAIIQRAGRVNRKREKKNTKVVVFQATEITKTWVYQDESNILENTFNILQNYQGEKLSEKQLSEMVDKVYKNMDIVNNEHYINGLKAYQSIYENSHYVKDNSNKDEVYTREGLDTINVIPACFFEKLYEATIEEKTKHELSVRKSKEYSFEFISDKDYFKYIKADYSYETGLIFRNTNMTKFY